MGKTDRRAAMMALKRKKTYQQQKTQLETLQFNLSSEIAMIEGAQMMKAQVDALKGGADGRRGTTACCACCCCCCCCAEMTLCLRFVVAAAACSMMAQMRLEMLREANDDMDELQDLNGVMMEEVNEAMQSSGMGDADAEPEPEQQAAAAVQTVANAKATAKQKAAWKQAMVEEAEARAKARTKARRERRRKGRDDHYHGHTVAFTLEDLAALKRAQAYLMMPGGQKEIEVGEVEEGEFHLESLINIAPGAIAGERGQPRRFLMLDEAACLRLFLKMNDLMDDVHLLEIDFEEMNEACLDEDELLDVRHSKRRHYHASFTRVPRPSLRSNLSRMSRGAIALLPREIARFPAINLLAARVRRVVCAHARRSLGASSLRRSFRQSSGASSLRRSFRQFDNLLSS